VPDLHSLSTEHIRAKENWHLQTFSNATDIFVVVIVAIIIIIIIITIILYYIISFESYRNKCGYEMDDSAQDKDQWQALYKKIRAFGFHRMREI
jgi:hypothetical protein